MNRPAISVIMANYNTNEQYLRESIESVLSQTFEDFELIVVDDGSTGNDTAVIESYEDKRIKLIRSSHLGGAGARNIALSRAQAPYIAIFDADDICLPARLEKQWAFMENHSDIDILSAREQCFGTSDRQRACFLSDAEEMACALFFGCQVNHPTVMMRTSFLKQYSLRYNLNFPIAQDYELWSRCIFLGKIVEYPEILIRYRCHDQQVTTAKAREQFEASLKIKRNMLSKLSLIPSMEQMRAHVALSNGLTDDSIPLGAVSDWAETLLAANSRCKRFHVKKFERRIMCHYAVLMAKMIKRGVPVLSPAMSKKAFSPRWLRAYAVRAALPLRLR